MAPVSTALVILALLGAVIIGLRPYLPRRERPSRIIGKRVRIFEIEGSEAFPSALSGVVEGFDDSGYRLRLSTPLEVGAGAVSLIHLTARHRNYPVSSAATRGILAVCGSVNGNWPFIARVNLEGV
jgi:hypothetical protein